MLKKCNPVETRKNLDIANNFARLGLDFVVIPVFNQENKNEFLKISDIQLEKCCLLAEQE